MAYKMDKRTRGYLNNNTMKNKTTAFLLTALGGHVDNHNTKIELDTIRANALNNR